MGPPVFFKLVQWLQGCNGHDRVEEVDNWLILCSKSVPTLASMQGLQVLLLFCPCARP